MAKDGDTGGKPKRSMLDTFVAPRPNRGLMRALAPVNRVLCLGGIPGLRRVPGLSAIPGVRGLSDIVRIDLPAEQEERLRAFVTSERAVFLTPNHPEFFTDWMLDKELLSRVAPLAACWATNTIVNGMGARMQRFWLANNLIAQIPGAGGGESKRFSIEWAAAGNGVLLHPEGTVHWHADRVGRLFPGAIDMAAEAAAVMRARGREPAAAVVPIVWKLAFVRDEERALSRELAYVEGKLGLGSPGHGSLATRVAAIYGAMLARDEAQHLGSAALGDFATRQQSLFDALAAKLVAVVGPEAAAAPTGDAFRFLVGMVRAADRALRSGSLTAVAAEDVKGLLKTARRQMKFRPRMYQGATLTQEQIAENTKRIRSDYCTGGWRDRVDCLQPRPAGSRVAHIRIGAPIDVAARLAADGTLAESARDQILDELRGRMQRALDGINAEIAARRSVVVYDNPFDAAG